MTLSHMSLPLRAWSSRGRGGGFRLAVVATGGRFVAEAARGWSDAAAPGWIIVLGGLGQIVGLAIYFWTMWPQIRPVGSHLREAKGERF